MKLQMKKIKWLIAVLIFSLCFLLSSEMTQNYLYSFTNQFYYIDIDPDDREHLYDLLQEISENKQIPVFATSNFIQTSHTSSIIIFANDNDFEDISKQCDIQCGRYRSFFSGETTVEHRKLSEIISRSDITRFYFDTTLQNMEQIHFYLNSQIGASYVHKEDTTGLEWIIDCIWIIPFLFLLLLTWFSIQFDKKKNFVRISLGKSKINIIIHSVITDILVIGMEFILLYFILKRFIYIEYHIQTIFFLFVIFLFLNSILHFSLLKNKYKEIMYGANLNQSLLSNCYLMKAATLILTITSLSVNFYLIYNNEKHLKHFPLIQNCNNECFLNIIPNYQYHRNKINENELISSYGKINYEMNKNQIYEATVNRLVFDYLYEDKLKYVYIDVEDNEGHQILFLNDSSMIENDSLRKKIKEDYDFFFLFPKNFPRNLYLESDVFNSIEFTYGLPKGTYTYSYETYDFDAEVLYMNIQKEGTDLGYGFEAVKSPALIFCNISGEKLKEIHNIEQVFISDLNTLNLNTLRFVIDETDTTSIVEKYHLSECNLIVVPQQFENIRQTMMRIVLINTVISVFMMVFEFSIIFIIIRLEYVINAKTLSIKKILGYSILQKNSSIFGLNLFATFIGTITNFIASLMFGISIWYMVIIVGVMIFLIESIIIFLNIERFERANVTKILKGGSL